MELYNLVSFVGIFVLMLLAWAFSTDRRVVNWRVVCWGGGLQLLLGLFIFVCPAGVKLFQYVNGVVYQVLECAKEGAKFVFGSLADAQGPAGFVLACNALPAIIFFSALMALLYYFGLMQLLVRAFAWVFTKLMSTSGAESLCASSNIFVGIESATTIRPYLDDMTDSELCTILTAGMATIASSVLGFYAFLLQAQFPTIAGHLVSASILSAPAALVMSKLLLPETGKPKTLAQHVDVAYEKEQNAVAAVINGANTGLKLTLSIVALLVAFLGLAALLDLLLKALGQWQGFMTVAIALALFGIALLARKAYGRPSRKGTNIFATLVGALAILVVLSACRDWLAKGVSPTNLLQVIVVVVVFAVVVAIERAPGRCGGLDVEVLLGALVIVTVLGAAVEWTGEAISLRSILSLLGYPLALVIGVPPADASEIGCLIGQRAIVTELVSYQGLAALIKDGALVSPRSQVICAYALCGFAHVASLAIFVGGISALAPKRAPALARVSFRALFAATLACLMTGAVAGTFFSKGALLFQAAG